MSSSLDRELVMTSCLSRLGVHERGYVGHVPPEQRSCRFQKFSRLIRRHARSKIENTDCYSQKSPVPIPSAAETNEPCLLGISHAVPKRVNSRSSGPSFAI